jgi:Concanavalin A-like lectin/glucanases superfamily
MDEDLIDLLAALRGEDPEPSRCEELLARLREDKTFRASFVAEVHTLGLLKVVQGAEPRWLHLNEELGLGSGSGDQPGEEELEAAFLARLRDGRRRLPGHPAWWAAAAVVLIGLTGLLWSKGRREPPQLAGPPPAGVPRNVATSEVFAIVVQLVGVEWEQGEGSKPSEGDVLPACRLALRSGRVTLNSVNGVMLTLEGPADLEIVSSERVVCHRGKIRIRVPDGSQGFVVSAPGSDVTDLGTEFGMNVEADGKARIMVFQGKAEAAVINKSGSSQRIRTITEHRALDIDPGTFQLNDAVEEPGSYVSSPTLIIPPLAITPVYRDAVLAARPWGYWRFESMDGGAVPNEVIGRPPLLATGPVRLVGSGNRSVAFGSQGAEQCLLMDGRWTPPRETGYAIELWLAPERIGVAAVAGLFVPLGGNEYGHAFQLELTSKDRQEALFQKPSIRFLHRWPAGLEGGDNLLFNYYVPYRWHHVVAQAKRDQIELFVNGEALPPLLTNPGHQTEPCSFLLGRLKPLPRLPGFWQSRPFGGQLDEVALYDHPLAAEEVRRHYRLGTAKPSTE